MHRAAKGGPRRWASHRGAAGSWRHRSDTSTADTELLGPPPGAAQLTSPNNARLYLVHSSPLPPTRRTCFVSAYASGQVYPSTPCLRTNRTRPPGPSAPLCTSRLLLQHESGPWRVSSRPLSPAPHLQLTGDPAWPQLPFSSEVSLVEDARRQPRTRVAHGVFDPASCISALLPSFRTGHSRRPVWGGGRRGRRAVPGRRAPTRFCAKTGRPRQL